MMFEWTVGLGNVLTAITMIVCGVGFVYSIRTQVLNLADRLHEIDIELHRLTEILIQQGRQDERMNAIDARMAAQGKRLDELILRHNKLADS